MASQMFQKIKDQLQKVDIFGQQITLSFRQEEQYQTIFGGIMSLCILGTIISFFYSSIFDFFQKNQLTSKQELLFSEDPDSVIIDEKDFMFAVSIDQVNFTTNPYFNITVEQRQYIRDENGTQIKLPTTYIDLIPCTMDHFQPIFEKYNHTFETQFKQYNIGNFLCPNLTHLLSKNMTIGGVWTSKNFTFLKLSVTTCKSNINNSFSWKPECKSQEEMLKQLKLAGSFRLQIYTTNYLINSNSAHHFIEPYIAIEQFYSIVPNSIFVQSDIFIRSSTITTDDGILMYPDKSKKVFTTRDYRDNREQISVTDLSSTQYGAFYFVRSPFSYNISRSYTRIDQLFSYLGGFSQFMIVFLGIFIKFYNRQHMLIEMANDLYEFDLNKQKRNTIDNLSKLLSSTRQGREVLKQTIYKTKGESAIQIQSMSAFSSKPEMGQFLSSRSIQRQESMKLNQFNYQQRTSKLKRISEVKMQCSIFFKQFKTLMSNQQHIGLSFRLILSQLIPFKCFQSDECMVLHKAIAQVNKELDIQYIIKQLHETIKLKKVLFNQDQITLFNFSHRPTISLIKERGNRKSIITQQIQEFNDSDIILSQLFKDLLYSYQKIIGIDDQYMSDEQIRFNQRLITLLGGKLPILLEKELADESDSEQNEQKVEEIINN